MENNRKIRKLNNKGLSMVEIIVVVALMAILVGGVSLGFAVITNSYAKEAASYVTDALGMTRTKATSITATEWNMTIKKEDADSGYIIEINKVTVTTDGEGNAVTNSEVIESYVTDSGLTISYKDGEATSDGSVTLIEPGDASSILTIKFNGGQGSIQGAYLGRGGTTLIGGTAQSDIGCIIIQSGSFSRTIEIYHTTGKYDIIDD